MSSGRVGGGVVFDNTTFCSGTNRSADTVEWPFTGSDGMTMGASDAAIETISVLVSRVRKAFNCVLLCGKMGAVVRSPFD